METCLDDDTLQRYVDGALSEVENVRARRHCEDCERCRARVDERLRGTQARSGAAVPAHPASTATAPLSQALDRTAAGRSNPTSQGGTALERGTALGRYVLLERIGAGGMGEVYAAYDPQLDRKVALKLLRSDLFVGDDASLGRSRLLREAQAVARLSHPNVIGVHDVGTFGAQVFVALEFVEGKTLKAWLEASPRGWEEVLTVFLQAGRGLAAAHAAGLVHRDFKPDNVLLSDDGRARVLDFGLARTAGEAGPSASLEPGAEASAEPGARADSGLLSAELTHAGTVLGTPAYMAPEQLLGQTADPRTDQFNFCASLYEALYGVRPFSSATFSGLTAAIMERRFASPVHGQNVPAWIHRAVLRGLEADRAGRFDSMDALLRALAADPRVRRHRLVLAGAVASLLTAAVVFGLRAQAQAAQVCRASETKLEGTWDTASRAQMREAFLATGAAFAPAAWKGAEQRLEVYASAWVTRQQHVCEALQRDGDGADERVWLEKVCLDRRLGELQSLTRLFRHADRDVAENAVAAVEALGSLSACWRQRPQSTPQKPPAGPLAHQQLESLRGRLLEVKAMLDAGKYAAGLAKAKVLAADAKPFGYQPLTAEVLVLLGRLQDKSGDLPGAELTLHEALVASELGGHDEASAHAWSQLAWVVGAREAKAVEGHRWARHAEAALRRLGDSPELTAELHHREGSIYLAEGKFDEARGEYQRALDLRVQALGPSHRDVAASEMNLGIACARLGKLEEALRHYQRAQEIYERAVGPEHPSVAGVLTNMGVAYARLGKDDEALLRYRRASEILEKALGLEHPQLAQALTTLGAVYARLGRTAEALDCAQRGLAIREKTLGPEHPQVADSLSALASVRASAGELAQAETLFRRSIEIARKRLGAEHPDVLNREGELGALLLRMKRPAEAGELLRHASKARARSTPKDAPSVNAK